MSMFDKLKDQVANAGEKLKEEIQKAQEQQKEKRVQSEADRTAWNGRFEKIKVSTSSINQQFEVVDVVFAFDSHKEGFLENGADPTKAFLKVVNRLRSICADLGGDAVINCQFDYRYAVGSSLVGNAKQVIEIYAYGTAVKYL
jgi:predicted nuclease with TOPRIM domain|uniref:heavy metal-binding domain-containing protein n=1 Tax=Polynucleobacter sp. TaxID=2029855 RepID=UPI0040472B22